MESATYNNAISIRIELIVSSMKKAQLKSLAYKLFDEFGIDDDCDLLSIEYNSTQQKNRANLYDQCLVHFRQEAVGEMFYAKCLQYIDVGDSLILSVKRVDDDTEYIGSDEEDGSISVINSMSSVAHKGSIFASDSNTEVPTSISKHHSANNMACSSLVTHMKSPTRTKNDDNWVEIQITPPIKKENSDDLEVILLFLQNKRRSDGGDLEEYRLNDNKSTLTVLYKDNEAKTRVLARRVFTFGDYTLVASEPFSETLQKVNQKVLIIRNISNTDHLFITLYAENIVPDNEIVEISTSKIFPETFYIKFENDFDYGTVEERHQKRPVFRNRTIQILKAYQTKSIVCVQDNRQEIIYDLIDLHFTNKKRSGVDSYFSIKEKKPFVIIQFETDDQVNAVLSRKHDLCKQELLVENNYNLNLIEDALGRLVSSPPSPAKQIISKKSLSTASIASSVVVETNKASDDAVNKARTVYELNYKLDETKYPILYNLLCKCDTVFQELKNLLNTKSFELLKVVSSAKSMFLVKKSSSQKDVELSNQVDRIIENFMSQHRLAYELLDVSANDSTHALCNRINSSLDFAYISEKNGIFEFYGDKNLLENVQRQMKTSQVDKDRTTIMEKVDLALKVVDEPRLTVLFHFDGLYWNQFKNGLKMFNLNCQLQHEQQQIVIAQMPIESKQEIDNFIREFLEKFKMTECTLTTPAGYWSVVSESVVGVHVEKNSANQMKIYGSVENVDGFVQNLNKNRTNELCGFSLPQGRILYAIEYRSVMEAKFPDLTIRIDTKKSKISFDSQNVDHIEEAKAYAREIFSKVCEVKFLCEPVQKEFMVQNERSLISFLRDNKLLAVFDLKDPSESAYQIYALSKDEIRKCYDLFTSELMTKKYGIDDTLSAKVNIFLAYLESDSIWNGKNVPSGYIAKIIDPNTFCICGLRTEAEQIDRKFRDFIANNYGNVELLH